MLGSHLDDQIILILNCIEEGALLVDKKGKIVFANDTFQKLMKIDYANFSGKIISPFSPKKTGFTLNTILLNGKKIQLRGRLVPLVDKDGEESIFLLLIPSSLLNGGFDNLENLDEEEKLPPPFSSLLGNDKKFRSVLRKAWKASLADCPVCIIGESGTGKELLARAIHFSGPRKRGPFIKVNCAAIPDELLESELFGYEPGAFTGAKKSGKLGRLELAHGGSLFLDEIGDMSPSLQAKLLRCIEEREFERLGGTKTIKVDVNFIYATNKDLHRLVQEGKFREDLYHRINIMTITIPALREKKGDLKILADHFLKEFTKNASVMPEISDEVISLLSKYDFPGNVRELRNLIRYAVIMAEQESKILPHHLPSYLQKYQPSEQEKRENLQDLKEEVEKQAIINALEQANKDKKKAIEILGMTRSSFYGKLKKYGIG